MSTLEEVDKGGENFNEEDETIDDISDSSENKVIVRMRDKKSLSRPQSDETSRVRWGRLVFIHSFIYKKDHFVRRFKKINMNNCFVDHVGHLFCSQGLFGT